MPVGAAFYAFLRAWPLGNFVSLRSLVGFVFFLVDKVMGECDFEFLGVRVGFEQVLVNLSGLNHPYVLGMTGEK